MRWRMWSRSALALALMMVLATSVGCGEDDDDGGNDNAPECERNRDCDDDEVCNDDGECEEEEEEPECERDRDCDDDETCEDNECVPVEEPEPECERDSDCDDDQVCEDNECEDAPPECVRDGDCGRDEVCDDGVCVPEPPECERDRDCDADEVCERGECVDAPPECINDGDCEDGELCNDDGECVEGDFPGQTDVALEPEEFIPEAYTVSVDATANMVAVGQSVTLTAQQFHGTPQGELSFAWTFEGTPDVEAEAADAPVQTLTFNEAGRFLVRLTATDEANDTFNTGALVIVLEADGAFTVGDVDGDGDVDGEDVTLADGRLVPGAVLEPEQFDRADVNKDNLITEADVELIQNAADAGALAPRFLNPTSGSFGRKINLIHPALLDPAASVRILFEGAAPQVPVRGLPGYATFIVPVELQTAAAATLSVEIDGQLADQFEFEILDAPQASEVPGQKLLEALSRIDRLVAEMPELTDEVMIELEATRDERAMISGMLQFSSNTLSLHKVAFEEAFATMEDEGKATFEQIALSNGLDDVLADLDEADELLRNRALRESGFFNVNPVSSLALIDLVCTLESILDISSKIAEINDIAANVISFIDFFPINRLPGVGAAISFLSSTSKFIAAVTGLLEQVGRFIPKLGDLEAVASATSLQLGESARVTGTMQLRVLANACDQAGGDLVGDLAKSLQQDLALAIAVNIPVIGGLFDAEDFDEDELNFIEGLIFDAISSLAGAILDAVGFGDLLDALLGRLCDFIGGADPVLQLEPPVSFSCGGDGDTFTCIENCLGTVTAAIDQDICGEETRAVVNIQCECESNCDEAGARTCNGQTVVECQEVAPGCLQLRDIEVCVDPEECLDGICVDPDACNAGTCPNGCCDSQDNCIDFGDQSELACGTAGNACFVCSGDDPICVEGVCQEAGGDQCSCSTPGTTFEIVEGCSPDTFPDAQECSGFHSVFCFNDNADPNDPLCQFTPESDEAFENTEFDSGTQFSAFDCTIAIVCP